MQTLLLLIPPYSPCNLPFSRLPVCHLSLLYLLTYCFFLHSSFHKLYSIVVFLLCCPLFFFLLPFFSCPLYSPFMCFPFSSFLSSFVSNFGFFILFNYSFSMRNFGIIHCVVLSLLYSASKHRSTHLCRWKGWGDGQNPQSIWRFWQTSLHNESAGWGWYHFLSYYQSWRCVGQFIKPC